MSEMVDYYPIGGNNVPIDINIAENPILNGGNRNYYGDSKQMLKVIQTKGKPEVGNRDVQAGIQYFTPKVGVNPKTLIQPIIAPRSLDPDVWGNSATIPGQVNKQTFRDVTESELQNNELVDRVGTRNSLGVPVTYLSRTPNSRVPQNVVNEPTNASSYPGGQMLYGGMDQRDFDQSIIPLYSDKKSFPIYKTDMNRLQNNIPGLTRNSYVPVDDRDVLPNNVYSNLQIEPTNEDVVQLVEHNIDRYDSKPNVMYGDGPDFTGYAPKQKEKFTYLSTEQPVPYGGTVQNRPVQNATPLSNIFYNEGTRMVPNPQYYDVMNRVPPGQNVQVTPNTDQLLQASPTYIYTDKYFEQPKTKLFLQDIQPKLYSYAVEQVPINSNIGITYAPQRPPKILDQTVDNASAYPLYTRIDPQLIRTEGTPGQLERNPTRTNWSSEYSNWQAAPGTVNFEDIYDPRFNSYGDPYRSYYNVNLGQVQYYYSDTDAYRRPNFITRSNVDFIEFTNPNGQVWPYYNRTASIDDVRAQVENQHTADELSFRQDMMESLMAKANREAWQLREAPLRRNANPQGFSYGPGSG
jgi:hypothetical protein